jgi:hypothetical protein
MYHYRMLTSLFVGHLLHWTFSSWKMQPSCYNRSLLGFWYTLNNVNALSSGLNFISSITTIQTSELTTTGLSLSFTEHQLARDTWSHLLPTPFLPFTILTSYKYRGVGKGSRTDPITFGYNAVPKC